MAVEVYLPREGLAQVPPGGVVLVNVDVENNMKAIIEVERWCGQNGLRRTPESHLRVVRGAGRRTMYRAHCYRPFPGEVEEDAEMLAAIGRELDECRRRQPESTPSELLTRGER